MGNRRALTNLKRRYQGEIGRLVTADTAMQEERKLRRQMNAKDSSMLYASDNLAIDDFLDGNTPNLYNISGTELYTRGAAAGKAASSRVYSAGDEGSTLNGYYRKWVERNGYSKESMDAFRANAAAIPELQQAADAILAERGVTENLTGNNLERARQSVLNGIIDGAVYAESVKPVRDAGVMSASERDASARGWAANTRAQQQMELSALQSGYKRENGKWVLDEEGLKNRAKVMGIAGYNPDDWEMGPDGKPKRKARTSSAQTPEEKAENSKQKELLKLDKGALAHNEGFDVTFGNDRHHYNYIGAISKHGDKWYHGAIGDDNPGHNWLRGFGFGSTSNVENAWGNFSAEGSDADRFMPG
jgi:ParB-like chromosome segregation protein Spo0J